MRGRGCGIVGFATVAAAAVAVGSCDTAAFLVLCDPTDDRRIVSFYSNGDCAGTNSTVFRGHEWLTLFGNDPGFFHGSSEAPIFPDDQIHAIIDGNRHTDYPKELLVHLDNGWIVYLQELLEYHNDPEGQADHFILRADNTHYAARDEALDLLRLLTHGAVYDYHDRRERALARIGKATHVIQDSYSPAHTVRSEAADPGSGNAQWCLCKLKTFVPRADGCLTDDIEFHDKFDDERKPGHLTALDSTYRTDAECFDPPSRDRVLGCMIPVAREAVRATEAYLRIARQLATTSAGGTEIDAALAAFFEEYFYFCALPATVDAAGTKLCDRPAESTPACE